MLSIAVIIASLLIGCYVGWALRTMEVKRERTRDKNRALARISKLDVFEVPDFVTKYKNKSDPPKS